MKKALTITNLLVIPLIASAVFLANPAFTKNPNRPELNQEISSVRQTSGQKPDRKKSIIGIVSAINGTNITVSGKDSIKYTVDATHATIMKDNGEPGVNPLIVPISNIQVGDAIAVRGKINEQEIFT
ncbi:MAG: hypothetical protein WD991_02680 [Candidatus Paceibacterota bacterium]